MKCPSCGSFESQVKDSRPSEDNSAIRRRRMCQSCGARFTTFERIQLRELVVKKMDGSRELFSREKLDRSLSLALRKRPIEEDKFNQLVSQIVAELESLPDNVISSETIGQKVMDVLAEQDQVAYVRYASVYKDFCNASDFKSFVSNLNKKVND